MSFILFQVLTKKDSRNLTKKSRPGCNFCIYATSKTFSAKADFFKKVSVTFVLWAVIPGVSVELSEKVCQNCILRFHKCFWLFFKYLQCHNILGLWKKYFPLFGKKVSEGLSNLPLRVQQSLLGRKISFDKNLNFLRLVGVSDENFRAFDKKMGGVAEIAIYLSSWSFWEEKSLWKELIVSLVSDFQRNCGSSGEKCFGVSVGVCVWGRGLPILHSTCLEKHFEKIHFFEKFVVSYFFSILDGNFSIFLHEILAGLSEPPRRRIWETRLFWRSFEILELLNFDRKELVGLLKLHLPV